MIKVEHVQASICATTGARIDTLILEYPRVVHSQLLTHRVFSKNSSSTRAIPLEKAIQQILDNPAEYVWTVNQAGMQGELVPSGELHDELEEAYGVAMNDAVDSARELASLGAHKQNAGRLLEPFQNIKIVLTSTEWANWDWLRDHEAAQGEIAELARAISEARAKAEPMVLQPGELHVPFVERSPSSHRHSQMRYYGKDHEALTPEEALLVSMSVCAQTSYRNSDYSLEKAIDMRSKLLDSDHVHASPSEHQAIAMSGYLTPSRFLHEHRLQSDCAQGVTHMDMKGNFWSGNFKGFIQHRQLIKGHDHALKDS